MAGLLIDYRNRRDLAYRSDHVEAGLRYDGACQALAELWVMLYQIPPTMAELEAAAR